MMRGYQYWKENFFLSDGTPKYYHSKTKPIDIQCCSQAIDTLVLFRHEDPDSLTLALKVARMDDSEYAGPKRVLLLPTIFPLARE